METHILHHKQEGVALLLVLWVLTLLTVIVGEFCFAMRTEVNVTRAFMERTKAHYIAEAGLYTALGELIRRDTPSSSDMQGDEDGLDWRINALRPLQPFGDGGFKVRIDNEGGKVNLNEASYELLSILFSGFDLDDKEKSIIVDSIMDWRDSDTLHRLNGAEDDFYQALPDPYKCKDGPFDSVEELMLVRGVPPELFQNGLQELISVLPVDPKKEKASVFPITKTPSGYDFSKISLNAASARMLQALPDMTEETAEDVIAFREEKDFQSIAELIPIIGPEIYIKVLPYLTLGLAPYYTITSDGIMTESRSRKRVQCLVLLDKDAENKYRLLRWQEY